MPGTGSAPDDRGPRSEPATVLNNPLLGCTWDWNRGWPLNMRAPQVSYHYHVGYGRERAIPLAKTEVRPVIAAWTASSDAIMAQDCRAWTLHVESLAQVYHTRLRSSTYRVSDQDTAKGQEPAWAR